MKLNYVMRVRNQMDFLRAAAGLAMMCRFVAACHAAADFEQQDIFVAGQDDYHTYRIPSLIATKRGTLLAFCEGRKNSGSDTGDIDIVLKRSTDEGKTWRKQKLLWDDGPNTCGNPCPVVDQATGTIWLLLTHNFGEDRELHIKAKESKGTRTVWVSKSNDDGKTWSAPTNITASTKNPSWAWYATGPGVGIQIRYGSHKGRLVIPCDHSVSRPELAEQLAHGSHIIFSDNHGKDWQIGGVVYPGMNECQVVELADDRGTLLLSMRNHPKGTNRAQSISADGGESWSAIDHHPQLIDPTCQASIVRFSWPGRKEPGRILFSNPASERRRNLTVRLSYDDGKTWPVAKVLHEQAAAYSCLSAIGKKEIGCLYERGETKPYDKITFAKFSLRWLEKP